MADLITVRILVFLAAFFILRRLLPRVVERPKRIHGLGVMAVATLIAFLVGAAVFNDTLGDTLVAWAVIYLIIAVILFLRWKVIDRDAKLRELGNARRDDRSRGLPDADS
jgi:hypothetical protein